MQQRIGVDILDRGNKLVDEILVLVAPNPLVTEPQVQRILQTLLVVGTDVQCDREREVWWYPRAQRVETQFADRNTHASNTLISQP